MKPADSLIMIAAEASSRLYQWHFPTYKHLYFAYKKLSDHRITSFLKKQVVRDMTVLDVGANIGFYSLFLADLVGKHGSVHSFEPCGETFQRLVSIAESRPQIVCNWSGAWSSEGRACLHHSASGNVDNWICADNPPPPGADARVPVITLDKYCLDMNLSPAIVKMDIQGAEFHALQGFRYTLENSDRMIMLIELWPWGLKRCGSSASDLFDLLSDLKLKYTLMNGSKLTGFQISDTAPGNYTNMVIYK